MQMALFFSVTLGISILGLFAILTLKRYELASGKVFLGRARPGVTRVSHNLVLWFEHILPSLVVHMVRALSAAIRRWLKQVVARTFFLFERGLEALLHTVREKTKPPRGVGQVSAFLREVADHKRELLKRSQSERFIADE